MAEQQPQVMDVSGVLANEKVQVVGHDDASGLPLIQNDKGQTATFNMREYAKVKYGSDIPANVKFQYNTAANPVQTSPESWESRMMMENFYDDKTKIAALTQRYGEVIPDKKNGLVVNNNGVYQAYSPSFLNTFNPKDLAEGFNEQLPKMVGAAGAATAIAAIAGAPVSLAAIAGTGLMAGLMSGAVRTSLGRLIGTYNASPEDEAKDIGFEGLVNMAGSFIPLAAEGGWGVINEAMGTLKKGMSDSVRSIAEPLFGKLTQAGAAATSKLIEDSPGIGRNIAKTVAEAGGTDEAVNLATDRAAQSAKAWLQQGVDALPAKFKASLDGVAKKAETTDFKTNITDIITETKARIEELNFGKFEDAKAQTTGKIRTEFRPLSEAEKTKLGVGDPSEATMGKIQDVVKLLGRYQNDGELQGEAAFRRLANLNKELNRIKYNLPNDATPEMQSVVSSVTGAFKEKLGQEFADKGLGEDWINANALYTKYADAVDQARGIINSPGGAYTFVDKINGKAGKLKNLNTVAGAMRDLTGDAGEPLYDKMLLEHATAKFTPWGPKLNLTSSGITGAAAASGHLPIAAATVASSSPRLVAKGVQAATAPGRALDAAHDAVLPFMQAFQDSLRKATPDERKVLLENPAYITGLYNTMQQAVMSIGPHTQSLLQGAQKQAGNIIQQGQRAGQSNDQSGK